MGRKSSPRRGPSTLLPLLVSLAGAVFVGGCAGDSEGSTKTPTVFESPEGRFRVELPARPERRQQSETTDGVAITVIAFTAEVDDEAYSVAFSDIPAAVLGQRPADRLKGVPEGAASRLPGKVRSSRPTTFQGAPAVDYVIDGEGTARGNVAAAKAFLAGSRLYVLQAVSEGEERPFFDRMVSSFTLTG